MATTGRWVAIVLGEAWVALLIGCPSLGAIGVGDARDGGVDALTPEDRSTFDAALDEEQDASSCKADTASDPKNCGRCLHSCGGGKCNGGVCQPYVIANANGPYGVAINGPNVYFTSVNNTVEMCTADSCMDTTSQIANGQSTPRHITTDSTNVYWANQGFVVDAGFAGSIATCGLAGCPQSMAMLLAPLEQGPLDIAVAAGTVYWTDAYGGRVRSCASAGCAQNPTTIATTSELLSGVAVDSTSIYWAEPKLGNIVKCPLSGCTDPAPFATGQNSPQQVEVVSTTLFWSSADAIMSCPASGCLGSPDVFANNQVNAFALASDPSNLYWTTLAGNVLSCPLSGCTTPTVLAASQGQPTAIAVDNTAVYWADYLAGAVMRVMK
jgi:hypothetical protein